MTNDEIQSMSDLVTETEEAVEISRQLHEFFIAEVKKLRDSKTEIELATLVQQAG